MSDQKTWFRSFEMLRSIAGAVVGEVIGRKRGNGLLGAGIGLVATRIATRSIPGLLLVGGAIAAKTIYDRRKSSRLKP
jgi:uncharacterized protein (DUF697 family)